MMLLTYSIDLTRGGSQSALYVPSVFEYTHSKGVATYPCDSRPFCECARDAIKGDYQRFLSIVGLFCRSGPAAILWTVIAIVINAIKRVGRSWSRSHVGKKLLKAMPPLADLDAAPTVPGIACVLGVRAARLHALPYMIFCGGMPPMLPGASADASDVLEMQTAAAFCIARSEIGSICYHLGSALARTQPLSIAAVVRANLDGSNVANDSQSAKLLPRDVLDVSIGNGNNLRYSIFGHRNLQLLCSGRRRSEPSSAAVLFEESTPIIAQMSEANKCHIRPCLRDQTVTF